MIDPADEVLAPDVAADAAKLADIFTFLADVEFPGYSPLYEHLATRIAAEPWIPAHSSTGPVGSFTRGGGSVGHPASERKSGSERASLARIVPHTAPPAPRGKFAPQGGAERPDFSGPTMLR